MARSKFQAMAAAKQRRGLPETFAQLLHPEAPPTNLSPTLQSARSPAFFVGGAAEGRGREELGWESCGYLHSAGCSGCRCGVGAAELVVGFVPNAGREVRWEAEGGGRWPHFYRWRGGRFPFCFLTHTLFEEGLLFIFIFFCAVAWFISRCIFFVERAVYVTPTTKLVERERERGRASGSGTCTYSRRVEWSPMDPTRAWSLLPC